MRAAIGFLICVLVLAGCGAGASNDANSLAAVKAVRSGALLVDVRSADEVKDGMVNGAINISHEAIVEGLAALGASKDQPVVLYCRSGNRSGKAERALRAAGYTQVINAGGYQSLAGALETAAP